MKTIGTIALALTAALALSACDPYTSENTGPGQILSVFTSSPLIATVDGTKDATGAWTVSGTTSDGGSWPVVWVRFDKLLDGFSIQASPQSCVPAPGLGLTVTESTSGLPTGIRCPAGSDRVGQFPAWYACYVPNTAITTEGAGVVFYLGCNDISSTGNATTLGGWNDNSVMNDGATYSIVANVKDKQGRSYPIDVTVETLPFDSVITLGTATATSQPMSWTFSDTDLNGGWDVQRAPNVPTSATPPVDAPGTYATLVPASLGNQAATFTDNTVVSGNKYWYRLISRSSNGLSRTSAAVKATIP